MTYASASDVFMYCRTLLQGPAFTDSTVPTESDVEAFLERGYSRINTALAGAGYDVPLAGAEDAYDYVVDLEAMFAASRVHLVRLSARLGPDEDSKAEVFMRQFTEGLEELTGADLSQSGMSRPSSQVRIGGISLAEKKTFTDDSDRVRPRFVRGQHRHPDTVRPGRSTSSEAGD